MHTPDAKRADEAISPAVHSAMIAFAVKYKLSEREAAVVRWAAEGLVTKEVADRLRLSPKTVEQYWARVKVKVGRPSRERVLAVFLYESLNHRGRRQPTIIQGS